MIQLIVGFIVVVFLLQVFESVWPFLLLGALVLLGFVFPLLGGFLLLVAVFMVIQHFVEKSGQK